MDNPFNGAGATKQERRIPMISDLIGQVFNNDGADLKQALGAHLEILHLCHLGNFVFLALLPEDKYVSISAVPLDEEYEKIRVTRITVSLAEQSQNSSSE